MALIDIPVSEPVRFEKLYGKSKLDIPGGIGQNNGTGPTGSGFTGVFAMKVFSGAVKLINKNDVIHIERASSGGYLAESDIEIDEMLGTITESGLPIAGSSLWLVGADAAMFKTFSIKTKPYTNKAGKVVPIPDGPITNASFKKLLAKCDAVMTVTFAGRAPIPKLALIPKGQAKAPAQRVSKEIRIGR